MANSPFPPVYDPSRLLSPNNAALGIAISSLSTIGVPSGVTYSFQPYLQPGVSALVGFAPEGITPGDPSTVTPATIVRAG